MSLKGYLVKEVPFLKVWGRTSQSREPLTLFWTGSGIECNIRASQLWIQVEADYESYEPWMSIVVDGEYVSRLMLDKGRQWICLFRGMDKGRVKNVKVLKEVQAMPEDKAHCMQVLGFKTDGAFLPVEEKKYKFEFIGDSITSGEGSIGAKQEEDWIPMWFSTQNNYVRFVSEAMDAEYRIISQSGWGVCCGWDNNPHSNIPSYYEQICGVVQGEKNRGLGAFKSNDFKAWQPDVIFINLGTNDESAFDSPAWTDPVTGNCYKQRRDSRGNYNEEDLQKVKKGITDFLRLVRRNNKASYIIWLYGMLGDSMLSVIEEAVSVYKEIADDGKVSVLKLPDTNEKTIGARQHPGVIAHQIAAKEITDYLSKLLL